MGLQMGIRQFAESATKCLDNINAPNKLEKAALVCFSQI